jgi:hypothetical protein
MSWLKLSFHRWPIFHESASKVRTLSDVLRQGISHHAKELKDAKAVIDGNLVRQSMICRLEFLFCLFIFYLSI